MLDVHPEPRHSRVEVHSGSRISDVGRLDESEFLPDINAAEKVLGAAIAAKRFALEAEKRFDFLYHFNTVDEYKAFLVDEEWGTLEPEVESRARKLLTAEGGELVMREPVWAGRLKRI
jgi:hypothetical protein